MGRNRNIKLMRRAQRKAHEKIVDEKKAEIIKDLVKISNEYDRLYVQRFGTLETKGFETADDRSEWAQERVDFWQGFLDKYGDREDLTDVQVNDKRILENLIDNLKEYII